MSYLGLVDSRVRVPAGISEQDFGERYYDSEKRIRRLIFQFLDPRQLRTRICPPPVSVFLKAISEKFWCRHHPKAYWPACRYCCEGDAWLSELASLQEQASRVASLEPGRPRRRKAELKEGAREEQHTRNLRIAQLERNLEHREHHFRVRTTHWTEFESRLLDRSPCKLSVVVDFADFSQGTQSRANDCIFSLYWMQDGKLQHFYMDVLSEATNNAQYFIAATKKILAHVRKHYPQLSDIAFFSDGGPKHFKNSGALAAFTLLKRSFNLGRLVWFFWAAYHGSSLKS